MRYEITMDLVDFVKVEALVFLVISIGVGYGVYYKMRGKVDELEKGRCKYGKACEVYNKDRSKEALDRVVNLLIRRVAGCRKGVCDGCVVGCDKSEAIKVLNEIRKV